MSDANERSLNAGVNGARGNHHFDAPWGKALKVVTALSCGLLIGIGGIGFLQESRSVGLMLAAVIPPVLLVASALFMIRGYRFTQGSLEVQRLLWRTRIPLNGLEAASHEPNAMRGSIRLFGNGGLFSFTGIYRNKDLGVYRAFVTDMTKCVVLRFSHRTIVVSPGAPEEFIETVRSCARTS